ncbi:MAG: acylphosphatase [Alphaproteobacteria bacterium]|nr:acylphosphatase [Alphaproteobacteria bacterium]
MSGEGTEDLTCLRFRIEGHVQAVGYRNYVIAEARRLGLDGWVRNRSDGTVEALAAGPTKAIESFFVVCSRGPSGSRVENVQMEKAEPPTEKGFRRRPSI